eukprot:GGOE01045880.1.p1 GENE.GGOE01045880.1~~GGOE01045880.1.p1  ORF type:complete len:326 (-),score=87.22 GGOE01045880.1:1116-2093(-)
MAEKERLQQSITASFRGIDVSDGDPEELFELVEIVGRGAYGAVWKALDRHTASTLALKLIPYGGRDEGLDAVRLEISILRECHHPNIVAFRGTYLSDGNLWIMMEYCAGKSVSDIMTDLQRPLQESAVAIICREALQALAYLHQQLKIHRDVKCSNILLTEQGDVKLADFGVSAQLMHAFSSRTSFVGTSCWMAPEVIQEQHYNGRADVWSLGMSCIEMAELNPPVVNLHPFQWVRELQAKGSPTFSEPEKWSAPFRDFTAACLTIVQAFPWGPGSAVRSSEEEAVSNLTLVTAIQNCCSVICQRRLEETHHAGPQQPPCFNTHF